MEPTDFTAVPRTGKAVDFVYRCSFFEKPMISLAGKHFTIHDSSKHSTHRADASSIELSDAALSTALYILSEEGHDHGTGAPRKSAVEMGKDGYPVLWMKFSASRKPDTASSDAGMASGTASSSSPAPFEVKPYRVSFVRAALMLTEARQEAQLQVRVCMPIYLFMCRIAMIHRARNTRSSQETDTQYSLPASLLF